MHAARIARLNYSTLGDKALPGRALCGVLRVLSDDLSVRILPEGAGGYVGLGIPALGWTAGLGEAWNVRAACIGRDSGLRYRG